MDKNKRYYNHSKETFSSPPSHFHYKFTTPPPPTVNVRITRLIICEVKKLLVIHLLFMKYFLGKNSDRFPNVVTPTLNDLFNHLSTCTSHMETITLGSCGDLCLWKKKTVILRIKKKIDFIFFFYLINSLYTCRKTDTSRSRSDFLRFPKRTRCICFRSDSCTGWYPCSRSGRTLLAASTSRPFPAAERFSVGKTTKAKLLNQIDRYTGNNIYILFDTRLIKILLPTYVIIQHDIIWRLYDFYIILIKYFKSHSFREVYRFLFSYRIRKRFRKKNTPK